MVFPLDQQVARSLDAPVELLPHLAELLADFDELGSSIDQVLEAAEGLGLSLRSRVLDLGCGKGLAGVRLAERHNCHVKGIDGFEPFVQAARLAAVDHGVSHLCEFHCADLRDAARLESELDVVMLLAVGAALGDQSQTIEVLRSCVKPGGYLLIDDAYLLAERASSSEADGYVDLEATRARLTCHGDRIVSERVLSREEAEAINARNTAFIEARAHSLAVAQPELAALLEAYLRAQRAESERLEQEFGGALWCIEVVG